MVAAASRLRLGQLVCNLAAWVDPSQNIVWDVEDDVLLAEAQRHLAKDARTEEVNGTLAAKS